VWRITDFSKNQQFATHTGISPNEIERLIEISKELVKQLSYANDRSTFAFNLDPASDTYRLLDRLLKAEG
jgi:hypothetical protein